MTEDGNKIELPKEKRREIIGRIRTFFLVNRDEDLGDLAAEIILDFFLDDIAPEIYNQGLQDSYDYLSDKLIDLLGLKK